MSESRVHDLQEITYQSNTKEMRNYYQCFGMLAMKFGSIHRLSRRGSKYYYTRYLPLICGPVRSGQIHAVQLLRSLKIAIAKGLTVPSHLQGSDALENIYRFAPTLPLILCVLYAQQETWKMCVRDQGNVTWAFFFMKDYGKKSHMQILSLFRTTRFAVRQ